MRMKVLKKVKQSGGESKMVQIEFFQLTHVTRIKFNLYIWLLELLFLLHDVYVNEYFQLAAAYAVDKNWGKINKLLFHGRAI